MIYLFRIRVSFVACRVPVVFRYVWILFKCGLSYYAFSLFQSFMFRYAILDLVAYRHYKDSTLLLCTHIVGRFFAREYLYIA